MDKRILYLMLSQDMSEDDVRDVDGILDDFAEHTARMREIQPYLDGTKEAPASLKRCLIFARTRIGCSVGITIDVIDLWLNMSQDADRVIDRLVERAR